MSLVRLGVVVVVVVVVVTACGPGPSGRDCVAATTDLSQDPDHCGSCGNACGEGAACIAGQCLADRCQPGVVEPCYDGQDGTAGVGPCVAGVHACDAMGRWSRCDGQVVPTGEDCADGIDNNCNGLADEDLDADHDGFTTCGATGVPGDCCDSTECSTPELVNAGAFDAAGNGIDDDCNGVVDDTVEICDQQLASNTTNGIDFAKAIDLCRTTTDADRTWGVIDAKVTLADGTGVPDKEGYAIRSRFGPGTLPQGGVELALISSGGAAAKGDVEPGYHDWVSYAHTAGQSSGFPADWLAANNHTLPNAPGCPPPDASDAHARDSVMLTFRVRVPTNARSFKLSSNFFSSEFPEWTCTRFNDFFVVLLDSTYRGTPANPADKNLAIYQPTGSAAKVPVGVNLAWGDTGLFTQCVNGTVGCSGGTTAPITSCTDTAMLANTGFDDPSPGLCDPTSLKGGATGWLLTSGNVTPGEIMSLRIAIWDTSDASRDSLAAIDGFQWSTELAQPGTVIFSGTAP